MMSEKECMHWYSSPWNESSRNDYIVHLEKMAYFANETVVEKRMDDEEKHERSRKREKTTTENMMCAQLAIAK